MRKVREVLRLRHALSLSYREIHRAEVVSLTWPLPQLFDDGELERRWFMAPGEAQAERPAPDWAKLHEELKRQRDAGSVVAEVSREASGRPRL